MTDSEIRADLREIRAEVDRVREAVHKQGLAQAETRARVNVWISFLAIAVSAIVNGIWRLI